MYNLRNIHLSFISAFSRAQNSIVDSILNFCISMKITIVYLSFTCYTAAILEKNSEQFHGFQTKFVSYFQTVQKGKDLLHYVKVSDIVPGFEWVKFILFTEEWTIFSDVYSIIPLIGFMSFSSFVTSKLNFDKWPWIIIFKVVDRFQNLFYKRHLHSFIFRIIVSKPLLSNSRRDLLKQTFVIYSWPWPIWPSPLFALVLG